MSCRYLDQSRGYSAGGLHRVHPAPTPSILGGIESALPEEKRERNGFTYKHVHALRWYVRTIGEIYLRTKPTASAGLSQPLDPRRTEPRFKSLAY